MTIRFPEKIGVGVYDLARTRFAILEKRKKRLDEWGGGIEARLKGKFRNPRAP